MHDSQPQPQPVPRDRKRTGRVSTSAERRTCPRPSPTASPAPFSRSRGASGLVPPASAQTETVVLYGVGRADHFRRRFPSSTARDANLAGTPIHRAVPARPRNGPGRDANLAGTPIHRAVPARPRNGPGPRPFPTSSLALAAALHAHAVPASANGQTKVRGNWPLVPVRLNSGEWLRMLARRGVRARHAGEACQLPNRSGLPRGAIPQGGAANGRRHGSFVGRASAPRSEPSDRIVAVLCGELHGTA